MDSIPPEVLEAVQALTTDTEFVFTGSRAISPNSVSVGADWDFAILWERQKPNPLLHGYSIGSSYYAGETLCCYKSVGGHRINLVLCLSKQEYQVWVQATQTAQGKDLTSRRQRLDHFAQTRKEVYG